MSPLMRRCLLLISILLLTCQQPVHAAQIANDSVVSKGYHLLMQVRGHEVTTICIMNMEADAHIVGTVINEFGIKVFDFTYDNGKAQILNVFGPLNKWYIKKVLRGDFSFILSNIGHVEKAVKKKRRLEVMPNGDISVCNERYNINYLFTPIKTENETTE